jgi:hypothetical protein
MHQRWVSFYALTFPEAVIEGRIGLKTGILVKPGFREGGKVI